MAVREIPAAFEHVCDGCGKTIERPTISRPPHWSELIFARDAYDFQGAAVADGTVRRLLCEKCSDAVAKAVNAAIASAPEA